MDETIIWIHPSSVAGVNYEHDESTMCLTVRYAGLDGVRDPVRDEAEGGHYKHISNSNSYLLLSVYLSVGRFLSWLF